ncbi:unnamed protein product [Prorocentrum cordatum]|uniref:Uncharacterized protein n=1 Tax=Prorocentrum cordatum TaxID=2364126 RepID=A0ABN9TJT0_9DINO|nr:unnamed protein product [Polarella glacialis]
MTGSAAWSAVVQMWPAKSCSTNRAAVLAHSKKRGHTHTVKRDELPLEPHFAGCKVSQVGEGGFGLAELRLQAQAQLQSSVVEVQNHLRVTCEEVCAARACSEEAYQSMAKRFNQIDENVRALEVELGAGTGEGKRQLGQVQGELAKIHESLAQVAGDLQEHRRASCAAHHRLLAQLSGLQGAGWSSPPCPAGGSPPPAVTSCTVSPARSMEAPSHGPPAGWQLGSPGTPIASPQTPGAYTVALPAPAAGSIAVQSTAESGVLGGAT